MKQTENLKLNKPEYSDVVDIEKLNENFDALDDKVDTIDKELGKKADINNPTITEPVLVSQTTLKDVDGNGVYATIETYADSKGNDVYGVQLSPTGNQDLTVLGGITTPDYNTSGCDDVAVSLKYLNDELAKKANTGVASQSANGLMASTDKTKLDGIASGANKTVVDSVLSSSSENPVQNKVVKSALDGKLSTTGGTLTGNLTGQYITGTWLQATAATKLNKSAGKIAVLDDNGWIYYRTPSEIKSDIGIVNPTIDSSLSSSSTNAVQNKVVKAALDGKLNSSPGFIEMNPGDGAGHGGYIDFHYNGSSADYTSRIIEDVSGSLNVAGTFNVNGSQVLTQASKAVSSYTSNGEAGRTIKIDGAYGHLIFIYGNNNYGFVFPWGSFYARYGTVTWQFQSMSDIKFENATLTFVTANAWANQTDHVFRYQVL